MSLAMSLISFGNAVKLAHTMDQQKVIEIFTKDQKKKKKKEKRFQANNIIAGPWKEEKKEGDSYPHTSE